MKKKVIVIGLDGLEPSIVESMLSRGELPYLARLRSTGSYNRLATTYPAQTPVAWSSFVTGRNPGGHGIFDFIRRDPGTYLPDVALSQFEPPKSVLAPPRVVNRRKGTALWQPLTQAGIPSVVLRCPCTFPPESLHGRMLAGVGVPDVRGSQSKGTFYTQESNTQAQEGEQVVSLDAGDNLETYVIGPRNTRHSPPQDTRAGIRVQVDRGRSRLIIHTSGVPDKVEVGEGEWSDWVRFKFKFSMLQSAAGIVRFHLRQLRPHLEFYASAVNFDPSAPLFPVSAPHDYARELNDKLGPFSTLGMAEEHNGLNNGRLDEKAYLRQCALVLAERARLLNFELKRFEEGLLFMVFDTPDRVQHMLWRFRDSHHPGHDRDLAPDMAAEIEEHYRQCDALLAPVLEAADDQTLVMVLSDHGFNSFRRAFDTNTWLVQNGLLALRSGARPGEHLGEGFGQVDWSNTYAYALGLGGIYLNFKGRERDGILEEGADAERVRNAIERGLENLPDPESRQTAIRGVSRRESLYRGEYVADAPDLLVNFAPGVRVSWKSAVGGFADHLFEDNLRNWSGDHIIDPGAVPGILFMNRRAQRDAIHILDLAPTILSSLGVAPPPFMEGRAVF